MNFALKNITRYCEQQTSPHSDLLYQLERETNLKTLAPQMMSGHLQGQLLSILSKLIQPSVAVEIGTFTGYAALCIASGLASNGKLYTMEVNEELEHFIRKYIAKAQMQDKIELSIGDATKIIPNLPTPLCYCPFGMGLILFGNCRDSYPKYIANHGVVFVRARDLIL